MSAMSSSQLSLFGGENLGDPAPIARAAPADDDADARAFAVDPAKNVVLEASAGTGKTTVLVSRYLNLLKAGVAPANILAITFTRKAAAEMRERIVRELRETAARSEFDKARWLDLRDRLGEIAISTIDAFCLSLLREFPLEADLDPGFDMADETEVPRFIDDSLDRSLRIFAGLARRDPDVALVLAQLGTARTRAGLAVLLERRLVAWDALNRFLASGPADLTSAVVCRRAAEALQDALRAVPGGLAAFLADGPMHHARFQLLARDLERLRELHEAPEASVRALLDRVAAHFLTADGRPRVGGSIPPYRAEHYPSTDCSRRHRAAVVQVGAHVERVVAAFNRDLNIVLARGVRRMFGIAVDEYRRALEERSVLDFTDVLQRALELLRRMDEFSQSRFRLESRFHHVLVDEFQDTSRAQWELVSLLIQSWGEGLGLATSPSIFVVGDRKQSIYRFRDADVAVLGRAARHIEALRPGGSNPRRSITRSFRAVPELLEFVNDLFTEIASPAVRPDDFTYDERDRFPVPASVGGPIRGPALGMAVGDDPLVCARAVALEIERVLRDGTVRDRKTGVTRQARPGDIGILFRSRSSHREFEEALEARGIPAYVYKGLGFFDADEIKDLSALLRYLADPRSDLRAAALLRSRFVRLSDRALATLAPRIASALTDPDPPGGFARLESEDQRVLAQTRTFVTSWLARVDRIPPADLVDGILEESAYAYEIAGPRRQQAWENIKKMRGLIRRIQNRGYATLPRIADHLDSLSAGDESNAILEALDAVNLMTVHAAKGLEFPIVFVVNLAKGASGPPTPIRIVADGDAEPSVSIGPFVSEADEADREREKHETRRLLYVALTRARDRLYLSSVLKDGALAVGRGSLAEVMPESVRQLFERAATAFDACDLISWTAQSGRVFDFRICRPEVAGGVLGTEADTVRGAVRVAAADVLEPIQDSGATVRSSVTEYLDRGGGSMPPSMCGQRTGSQASWSTGCSSSTRPQRRISRRSRAGS
jgi:ATP-dependent helicase/nuclease subunit A